MTSIDARAAAPAEDSGAKKQVGEVKSAARTVELLELLAAATRPMTLSDIASRLELPVSSVHQLLKTLVARGWLSSSGTTYSIGVRALLTGISFLERDPIVQAVKPVLGMLRSELEETVHLARLDGNRVVYLLSRESQHQLRMVSRVGQSLPAHATALGKAALSTLPEDEVRARFPLGLWPLTPHTITDLDRLLEDLARTRHRGFAQEAQENTEGTACVAVPIPGPAGEYAVSCSVPLSRLTPERAEEVAGVLAYGVRTAINSIEGNLA
ncbi:IclR family transcriptional regulator [Naasia sp. SYSU D00057]|uniref:IclR family transcriptional regulator n=1 Tax=Naasia sp. SYSU D00057 TaxID=2817380 RepID=UPI001B30B263|nr:IclR family transcriptional regulator [Naasia sp. SYSU D00057]